MFERPKHVHYGTAPALQHTTDDAVSTALFTQLCTKQDKQARQGKIANLLPVRAMGDIF